MEAGYIFPLTKIFSHLWRNCSLLLIPLISWTYCEVPVSFWVHLVFWTWFIYQQQEISYIIKVYISEHILAMWLNHNPIRRYKWNFFLGSSLSRVPWLLPHDIHLLNLSSYIDNLFSCKFWDGFSDTDTDTVLNKSRSALNSILSKKLCKIDFALYFSLLCSPKDTFYIWVSI